MYFIKNQSISVFFYQLDIKVIFDSSPQFKEIQIFQQKAVEQLKN